MCRSRVSARLQGATRAPDTIIQVVCKQRPESVGSRTGQGFLASRGCGGVRTLSRVGHGLGSGLGLPGRYQGPSMVTAVCRGRLMPASMWRSSKKPAATGGRVVDGQNGSAVPVTCYAQKVNTCTMRASAWHAKQARLPHVTSGRFMTACSCTGGCSCLLLCTEREGKGQPVQVQFVPRGSQA